MNRYAAVVPVPTPDSGTNSRTRARKLLEFATLFETDKLSDDE